MYARRRVVWIAAAAVCLAIGWRFVGTMLAIERQSDQDEAQAADVIMVMGAAEYRGRPSPVFRGRLDHALALYRRGLAPRIVTTGGAGGDPDFTEGEVARDYLIRKGVPPEAIIVEEEAETTAQSVFATAEIMQRMGLRSCILVSDGYHIFRTKRMLEQRGMQVFGSPRPSPPGTSTRQRWLSARQAAGYLLWSIGVVI